MPRLLHDGEAVGVDDLEQAVERWPRFAPKALSIGFRSVQAVPLRLRGTILGALNMFLTEPGGLAAGDLAVGQAMADVATIGLLRAHARRSNRKLNLVARDVVDGSMAAADLATPP